MNDPLSIARNPAERFCMATGAPLLVAQNWLQKRPEISDQIRDAEDAVKIRALIAETQRREAMESDPETE